MVDPTPLPGIEEKIRVIDERMKSGGGSDGHGPTDGNDTERRMSALEKSVEKIDGKLDKIIEAQAADRLAMEQRFAAATEANGTRFGSIDTRLATIDGKLDPKASAVELAEVKGRVNSLPTTWQMIVVIVGTVFTILGGAFLILKFGLPHAP